MSAVDPVPPNPAPSSGSGPSYSLQYVAAWIVAVAGVVSGVLAGAFLTVHPSWLTADVAGTAGIVSPICLALAALLPSVGHTPAARESHFLAAAQGVLPDDIAKKFPLVAVPQQIASTLPVTGPTTITTV